MEPLIDSVEDSFLTFDIPPATKRMSLELANFWDGERILESDGDRGAFPNVIDQRRSEAHDARSSFMPNARINDARRPRLKQLHSQML